MAATALSNPPTVREPDGTVPPAPGELTRLTGECLKAGGIRIRRDGDQLLVAPTARPRSKRKARETRAAQCALFIDDETATARLDFLPWAAETADGGWLADVASALLTGMTGTGPRRPDVNHLAGMGVKGVAGTDLRRRGFLVELNTYEDPDYFEVMSEIAVTVPGRPGPAAGGVVYIADDGIISWEHCYSYRHIVTGDGPGAGSELADPPAMARAIAGTVAAAVRAAWPELDAG